jgi:hypothetical protein
MFANRTFAPAEASQRRVPSRRLALAAVAFLVAMFGAIAGAGSAQAANDATPLGLAAVGQSGSYFDVTINPGATLGLEVARTNPGAVAVTAHSFAGSVFTIVNGGFGAVDSDAAATGATRWVNYPDEVFGLGAGATDIKGFAVTVPYGTPPGQYISSIVLQNNESTPGEGHVALDRIVRQAVAISIRVPGPLNPEFSVGAASHEGVGGRSVVSVALRNLGNQNLKPAGTMTIKDSAKKVVSEAPVTMGSVYAEMDTSVAVTFAGLFLPGEYTVTLFLTDPLTGVSASITDVPFTVVLPPSQSDSPVTQLPAIFQDAVANPGILTLILVAIGLFIAAALTLGIIAFRRLRAKVRTAGESDAGSPPPPTS